MQQLPCCDARVISVTALRAPIESLLFLEPYIEDLWVKNSVCNVVSEDSLHLFEALIENRFVGAPAESLVDVGVCEMCTAMWDGYIRKVEKVKSHDDIVEFLEVEIRATLPYHIFYRRLFQIPSSTV